MGVRGFSHGARGWRLVLGALFLGLGLCLAASGTARAADLPVAADSKIAGISFDDKPLLLPVQRNFQMAMLIASSELGRTCGAMESYGWRMEKTEQSRVNLLFGSTVDKLRAQGFAVEAKTPSSVSRDITIFTADRSDKHIISMWSAGDVGLVMVMCESSPPLVTVKQEQQLKSSKEFAATGKALRSIASAAPQSVKPVAKAFSPLGEWVGTYICAQGTTGGSITISKEHGGQFEGVFRFYPTPKNPYVPNGSYEIYGDYDADSQRILINPGKWLNHPKNYENTIMIGSFDPMAMTFSGYFQGVTGCTSLEAKYNGSPGNKSASSVDDTLARAVAYKKKTHHVVKHKKPVAPSAAVVAQDVASQPVSSPPSPSPPSPSAAAIVTPPVSPPAPQQVPVTTSSAVVNPAAPPAGGK